MIAKKSSRATGRCPGCGAAVEVETLIHAPARILPHDCRSRTCEQPGCRVTGPPDRMVRSLDGAWNCPVHALLAAAKALVALYQAPGDADWSEICAVIAEVLPDVIGKVEAAERV